MRLRSLLNVIAASIAACSLLLLSGCGVPVEPLMPTPLLYTEVGVAPFEHLPPDQRRTVVDIMYATNRVRNEDWRVIDYSNDTAAGLVLGAAAVRIGGPDATWNDVESFSTTATREKVVDIELSGIIERGGFSIDDPMATPTLESREFVDTINRRIAASGCRDVFIFVHGAKVDFYNACAFTGQLAHFMGRDMVGIAFAWPTSQDIFTYVGGRDVRRAYEAGTALASLVEFLAAHTHARRIHIICWSAGGRVVSSALHDLYGRHPEESLEQRRTRYRLGTVAFAAADIPLDEFLDRLDEGHALSDRLLVTLADEDDALVMADVTMGGGRRLGQRGQSISAEQQAKIEALDHLEWVDVSYGNKVRGFDITGHRYWYDQPWSSSDLLLAMRTGLPAAERGLEPFPGTKTGWFIPADYPQRLIEIKKSRHIRDRTAESSGP